MKDSCDLLGAECIFVVGSSTGSVTLLEREDESHSFMGEGERQ